MKQPPGPNFIIKDLPSVVILIITDNGLKHSLCCFNKYNWCLCTCISKLYILLLTCLINLSETCIIKPELFWIKHKLDFSVMKLGPEVLPLVSFIYLGEISVLSLFMEFWMVWSLVHTTHSMTTCWGVHYISCHHLFPLCCKEELCWLNKPYNPIIHCVVHGVSVSWIVLATPRHWWCVNLSCQHFNIGLNIRHH